MMSEKIFDTVRGSLAALGVARDDHLLLAISGGPDSAALLDILRRLNGLEFRGLTAAHLDHTVRGRAASDDARVVRELCAACGIPLIEGRLDAGEVDRERARLRSLEGALRVLRYSFLHRAADEAGVRWIAVAHNSDDQAETVLFRVRRGMDWRSFSGIPAREGRVIRPLMGVSRREILDYCHRAGLQPVADETNRDLRFARNRIRHLSLPALSHVFHRDIRDLLLRLGDLAVALRRVEVRMIDGLLPDPDPTGVEEGWDRATIEDIPTCLREGMILKILRADLSFHPKGNLIVDILRMIAEKRVGRISLSGGGALLLTRRRLQLVSGDAVRPAPGMEWIWPVPGRIAIPEFDASLTAEAKGFDGLLPFPQGRSCLIRKRSVRLPLTVRARRSGDRIQPLGMQRAKTLKRFLIDRKVPREERDRLPLVLDAGGEIIWIPGVEISEKVRLTPGVPEEAYLLRMVEMEDGDEA